MEQQFSIGEWVERKFDGAVGVVKRVQPGVGDAEGDFYFYVDLDPQRRVKAAEEDLWAGTTGAWRTHFRVHAHVDTSSRDCDGLYERGHVDDMTIQERCDQFGDLHFQQRVVSHIISLHGEGTLEVSPTGVHWHEQTDEGYRRAEVRWCTDECADERPWQRDHSAEAAGY